ncbi:MAG: SMP-30/gluconolactonase/LRE family protein [Algoriphagus sp.]|uniref:SMP-30/gluconolactonase/LRE family protein n=1 Tax=Algoriphagus sp. TaxID=1872435 RepID=UPI002730E338|nr:SMP-30/gluconolactonase/LRE family protein [Algoriphagus sp.]MDP2042929.1 SMP-30/gluconolactonase/LRE family protein [Algoriphagus sp.]MDP3473426.1 SMP-30/gluconolactonase/LRE family protein [Algoriphagus sp.]
MENPVLKTISSQCYLGEGPLWIADLGCFFWVDIEKGNLHRYHLTSEKLEIRHFPHYLAVVLKGQNGKLILGLDRKLVWYDWETEEIEKLCEVETNQPLHRFNDGKVDFKGRIWIGTLSTKFTEGAGSLYRIDSKLKPEVQLNNLTISNGMAWTEDQDTFYFIDTPTRKIQEFLFDPATGEIRFRRVAVEIPEDLGFPDGMCIDREGMLWVAHYGGSGVYRWNPQTGKLQDKIELPVPHVTSCCFGGENLDVMLITTAQENMTESDLKKYPQSGDVFLVKMEVGGFETNRACF